MESFEPQKYERYLLHDNESVDRLTTNRTFQRIYEDIEKRENRSIMSLNSATDNIYGTVKFNSASAYVFDESTLTSETSGAYYNDIISIALLKNYADSLSDSVSSSVLWSPSITGHETVSNNNYWVKTDYCNVDFTYMPNGVNCITGNLELGINNLYATFGNNNDVLSGDVMSPYTVDKYKTYINITKEDLSNFENYADYNEFPSVTAVKNLSRLDGIEVSVPFVEECEATVKQNICNWTTYSSFKQSFVELHYTTKIDMKTLYELKYGHDTFNSYATTGVHSSSEFDTRKLKHPKITFEQKPIIMMQVGFYGSESEVKPLFGFDNRNSASTSTAVTSEFFDYDTINEKPLTTNEENSMLSPLNGFVMVKKFVNEYDDDGIVTNNIIYFDVIMKFMVGSAADPKMIYGLTSINSKAKVQFAIIGV